MKLKKVRLFILSFLTLNLFVLANCDMTDDTPKRSAPKFDRYAK